MNFKIASIRLVFWTMISCFVVAYAIWYTTSSYQELIIWYQQLNPNFYKNDQWTDLFFTADVKYFGQWYTWAIAILSIFMVWNSYKYRFGKEQTYIEFKVPKITHEGIFIFTFTLLNWWFWQQKASYATDEVFSALNFADKPFFQTISHYPLPNNHIFYNAINHWFRFLIGDLVLSGRLISGFFMAVLMVSMYNFSDIFIKAKTTKILIILVLLSVFPIIGFATQARGYSLHMLLSWIAFLNLYQYSQHPRHKNMIFYMAANAFGMWTMPSYLYFWIGMVVAFCFIMVKNGKIDYKFIFNNVIVLLLILILYIPAITFSGWTSILANKYVASGQESTIDFIQSAFIGGYFQGLFNDFFGTRSYTWIGVFIIVLILPISLLNRRKTYFTIYSVSLIFVFLIMSLFLKKFPFYRNLVSHGLLIWYLLLLSVGIIVNEREKIYRRLFTTLLITLICYLTYSNFNKYPFHLYYYDVNGFENSLSQFDVSQFKNKRIFIHDESFFWQRPISKVSKDIQLGGIIDQSAEVIIVDKTRSNMIDTTLWSKQSELGESQLWINKLYTSKK